MIKNGETKKNSPAIHHGKNKHNQDAHKYAAQGTAPFEAGVANNKQHLKNSNVSVGFNRSNDYPPTKTSGIVVRGTATQTKGRVSRGPMA